MATTTPRSIWEYAAQYPEITIHGSGYVDWRGRNVEHYTFWNDEVQKRAEGYLDELVGRCRHLDALGVIATTGTAIWHSDWFATMEPSDPLLPFLAHTPAIYQQGCTETEWTRQRAGNHGGMRRSWNPNDAETGVFVICLYRQQWLWDRPNNVLTNWTTVPTKKPTDRYVPFSEEMQSYGFFGAFMGQSPATGSCYATFDQVRAYIEKHAIPHEQIMQEAVRYLPVTVSETSYEDAD